jgi:hypothetical protein
MQGITAPDVCNTVVEPVGALADTMKQNEGSTVCSTAPPSQSKGMIVS